MSVGKFFNTYPCIAGTGGSTLSWIGVVFSLHSAQFLSVILACLVSIGTLVLITGKVWAKLRDWYDALRSGLK